MLGLGNILIKGGAVLGFPNKYSFNFDGSNDYIEVQDTLESVFQASYSISLWLKADDGRPSSDQSLFGVRTSANSSIQNTVRGTIKTNGKLFFRYHDGSNVSDAQTNSAVFSDGATDWTHITIVVSESADQIYIYVNGSVQTLNATLNGDTSALTFSNFGTSNNFPIGGRNNLGTVGEFFSGLIDEFAIWDTALSADDVAKIASKPVDVTKYSASNLKLWLRAGDKAEPESTIARQDFYTDFSASNDYIDLNTDFESWIESPNRSFTTWVKNGGNTDEVRIFNVGYASNATGFAFGLDGGFADNIPFYFLRDTSAGVLKASFGDVLNTTDWYHFAITINDSANEAYLYQNGILKATVSNVGTPSQTTDTSAKIGGFWGNGLTNNFNGQISNMALYQTTLDAQTISQMAKSRFTPVRNSRFSVVDFDGSDDYISTNADSTLADATYTFWAKATETGQNRGVFGHGNKDIGGFHFNYSSNRPMLFMGSSRWKFWNDNSAQDDGQWHHFAVILDSDDITGCKLYIDGVEQTANETSNTGDYNAYTTGLEIGRSDSTNEWEGSMAQFAVYSDLKDSEFIYAQWSKGITADYSNDTNLSAYYKMGDDTSKAYPTIADSSSNSNDGTITNGASDDIVQQMVAGYDLGAFESSSEELGGEFITSNTASDWTDFVSNGTEPVKTNTANGVSLKSQGDSRAAYYTISGLTNGSLYKVVFNSRTDIVDGNVKIYLNASTTYFSPAISTTDTQYTIYGIAGSSNALQIFALDTGTTIFVENFSIKEVLQSEVSDTYPAIIDVNEPVLGVELVDTTTYTGGSAHAETYIRTSNVPTTGGIYKLTFDVDSYTSGSFYFTTNTGTSPRVEPSVYNATNTSIGSQVGSETYYLKINAGGGFKFKASNLGYSGSVSNISLKEIQGNVGTMTNQDSADLVYSSVLPDQSFLTGVNSAYNFLDFDGTDAYVDYGDIALTGEFTLVSWIYNDDVSDQVIWGDSSNADWFRLTTKTTADIKIANANKQLWTHGGSFDSNEWMHLAVVRDASNEITVFFNGVHYTDNAPTNSGTLTIEYLGRKSSQHFNGDMANNAIYNKALSSSEISAIYNAGRHTNLLDSYSDNLKAYFAFGALDSKTGFPDTDSTIYDRSGNSNHGTTSGTATGDLKSPPNAEPNGYAKGDTNRSTTTP